MPQSLSPAVAVKRFFEKDSKHGTITTTDFMKFWKACSDEEKQEFAVEAAKELGVILK